MKISNCFKSLSKVYALAWVVILSSCGLFVYGNRSEESLVSISPKDAQVMERALEYLINRAPRADAPEFGDPEFPVLDVDFDDIRRALCVIKNQLRKICDKVEDIQVDLSAHDEFMEECCSVVDEIDCTIGNKDDKYPTVSDCQCTNYKKYTVIQWLKKICYIVSGD